MLDKQRKKVGNYFLEKELQQLKRKVVVTNFKYIKSIGIVFVITDENSFKETKRYVKSLREEGIKIVQAIGFYDAKEMPPFLQYSPEFLFVGKKEVNWYFKPKNIDSANFVEEEFDVLIDLSSDEDFSSKYIFGISKSKMKIGRKSLKFEKIYDLIINIEPHFKQQYYLQQVEHYLKIINKS